MSTIVAAQTSGRDVQAEHTQLAEAALDTDADRATTLLREHYLETATHLAQLFPEQKPKLGSRAGQGETAKAREPKRASAKSSLTSA